MKITIIAERTFKHPKCIAVAKFYSLGGQAPYFSCTTDSGAAHDTILEHMPELKPIVDMHLCGRDGGAMHAYVNAVYHIGNADFDALDRHMGVEKCFNDLYVDYVQAKQRDDKVKESFDVKSTTEYRDLITRTMKRHSIPESFRAEFIAKPEKLLNRFYSGSFFKDTQYKKFIESVDKLEARLFDEMQSRLEGPKILQTWFDSFKNIWQEKADTALDMIENGIGKYDTIETDDDEPTITIDGDVYPVEFLHGNQKDGITVEAGGNEYVLFAEAYLAQEACERYWLDMVEHDMREFMCMVGEDNVAQHWIDGTSAKDLARSFGQDYAGHFARYDGHERNAELNEAASEELEIRCNVIAFKG